jgi:hypothetical protein
MSKDTNIVLYLKSGEEVKVIYPHRVFCEYHTPWLEHPGGVQTSNPVEDLVAHETGRDYRKANFVISTWQNFPKYLADDDGRIRTIPMSNVTAVIPADSVDAEIGNRIRQQEENDTLDESYKDGYVSRKDLADLFPDLAERILTRPR